MSNDVERDEARALYDHRHDEGEWSDVPVAIEVRPLRSEVVSFRLPTEEMTELETAARTGGESISSFVRKAITERLRRSTGPRMTFWVSYSYRAGGWLRPGEVHGAEGTLVSTEQRQFVQCSPPEPTLPGIPA